MPDFGFWELALIMLVALLVVGPQKLPRLAADLGAWFARLRKMTQRFKADVAYELNASELESTIGKPKKEIDRIRKEVQGAGGQISDSIRSLDPMHDAMREQISSGRYSGDDESLRQAAIKPTEPADNESLKRSAAKPEPAGGSKAQNLNPQAKSNLSQPKSAGGSEAQNLNPQAKAGISGPKPADNESLKRSAAKPEPAGGSKAQNLNPRAKSNLSKPKPTSENRPLAEADGDDSNGRR